MKRIVLLFFVFFTLCGCIVTTEVQNDDSSNEIESITVVPIENLKEDFACGVDISSIIEVEKSGGVFYNEYGKPQDIFEILKENGINYVRMRHWNNPENPPFTRAHGAGYNNLDTNIQIAKRAQAQEMKICLDFHYSDTWADPGNQQKPREWVNLTQVELENTVYEYTKNILEAFDAEGVLPDSVQLGNEIDNGLLGIKFSEQGKTGYENVARILKRANEAVKDVSPNIQTIIHLSSGGNFSRLDYFYGKMKEYNVTYDIIGLSYYSFWHGTLATFQDAMNRISYKYEKPVMVMEYSYAYTHKYYKNAHHIFGPEFEIRGGYEVSFQGQSNYIRDVIDAVNNVPDNRGLGAFYWEPAWLPVLDDSRHRINATKVSWANQALFTFTGHISPSLQVFNLLQNKK